MSFSATKKKLRTKIDRTLMLTYVKMNGIDTKYLETYTESPKNAFINAAIHFRLKDTHIQYPL